MIIFATTAEIMRYTNSLPHNTDRYICDGARSAINGIVTNALFLIMFALKTHNSAEATKIICNIAEIADITAAHIEPKFSHYVYNAIIKYKWYCIGDKYALIDGKNIQYLED